MMPIADYGCIRIRMMTPEQKMALSKEFLANMNLTKEQYLELCKLCDELDLEPKGEEQKTINPDDLSWDDILNQ